MGSLSWWKRGGWVGVGERKDKGKWRRRSTQQWLVSWKFITNPPPLLSLLSLGTFMLVAYGEWRDAHSPLESLLSTRDVAAASASVVFSNLPNAFSVTICRIQRCKAENVAIVCLHQHTIPRPTAINGRHVPFRQPPGSRSPQRGPEELERCLIRLMILCRMSPV